MTARLPIQLTTVLVASIAGTGCVTQADAVKNDVPSSSNTTLVTIAEPAAPSNESLAQGTREGLRTRVRSPSSSRLRSTYGGKKPLKTLNGKATYYADSLAGNLTANGDIYNPAKFTAAHRQLRFGTIVRVTRKDNGKTTYARVNDRGPFSRQDRIIDLSKAAAQELGMMKVGVVPVRVEILERPRK